MRFMGRLLCAAAAVVSVAYSANVPSYPTQIHLALGHTPDVMVVSWSTGVSAASDVLYSTDKANLSQRASGTFSQYTVSQVPRDTYAGFVNYTSPFLHAVTLSGLSPRTQYYYKVGDVDAGVTSDVFSFTTMPNTGPDVPVTFSIIGDLGQTDDSHTTSQHVLSDAASAFIFHVGDMSYSDCDGDRWDTYFNLMEPLSTLTPWMVTPGNHEVEPSGDGTIMTPYKYRYNMPQVKPGVDTTQYFQKASNHGFDCTPSAFTGSYDFGNSFYSVDVGSAHFVFLNSYTRTDTSSNQYKWLEDDLAAVDRTVTPWIIAGFHSPWYSSNRAHFGEFNEVNMRDTMEPLFYKYGVSAAFSGHVHAYERSHPVYLNSTTPGATTYLVIGDGGNREGHAVGYADSPAWSAFRDDASYGHGRLAIVNRTHAQWQWHRNEDSEWTVADDVWIHNREPLERMLKQQQRL